MGACGTHVANPRQQMRPLQLRLKLSHCSAANSIVSASVLCLLGTGRVTPCTKGATPSHLLALLCAASFTCGFSSLIITQRTFLLTCWHPGAFTMSPGVLTPW